MKKEAHIAYNPYLAHNNLFGYPILFSKKTLRVVFRA